MRRASIACIVEGYGEVEAVPVLMRRLVRALDPSIVLNIPHPPVRVSRSKLVHKSGELEKAIELAARKNDSSGAILILLDADNDCPAELAPRLLQQAQAARSHIPIAVVLAQREYEAWFLAAASSLRGRQGLSDSLEPPHAPENIQGAKEWLERSMVGSRKYKETIDQPLLTRHFDLEAARRTASFDKLYRDVARLLTEMERLATPE